MRIALFITVFLLLPLHANGQFYPAKIYTTVDGMPSNALFDVTQDDEGVMWFVTSKGIATYDAHEWYVYPDSLQLPTYLNTKIDRAEDGSIWIVGRNRSDYQISSFKDGEWTNIAFPDTWANYNAFTFEVVSDSTGYQLIMGNLTTIFNYDFATQTWDSTQMESLGILRINSINHIDETYYVNTTDGQFVYENGEVRLSNLNDLMHDEHVLTMTKTNGRLYVLGFNWLGVIDNKEFELLSDDLGITVESASNRHSLVVDSRERVFYCSFSNAQFFEKETGTRKYLAIDGREKNINSNKLFLDRENNIWSVDNRGLFKFNLIKFENFNQDAGLTEDEVTAILETSNGDVLIANEHTVNTYRNGEIISRYDIPIVEDEKLVRILDMAESPAGFFYLATNKSGLLQYNETYVVSSNFDRQLGRVTTIEEFKGDFYTSDGFHAYMISGNTLNQITKRESKLIRNLISIEDSVLAILTMRDGIGLYEDGAITYYTSDISDANNTYSAVKWRGEIYVATSLGLAVIRGDKLVLYSDNPPFNEVSFALLVDSRNHLWVGTFNGVYEYTGEEVKILNKGQGLIGNEINRNALIEHSNQEVWIGTELGLSIYNENEDISSTTNPQLKFMSITSQEGLDLLKDSSIVIPYSDNTIQFDFRGVSFIDNDIVEYRYLLSGIDTEWRTTNSLGATEATYTNLNHGSYTFAVQARNESSDWGAPVTHSFTISKPIYLTYWFMGLIAIVVIGIFYAAFRIRYLYLLNLQERLKTTVDARTKELNEKSIEVENKNEQLNQANTDLKEQKESLQMALTKLENTQVQLLQSEKMAALGVLTAGVAHEINNPVNFIKSGAEVLKSLTDEYDNKIIIEEKDLFEEILKSFDVGVNRIVNIVQSLNSFSRTNNSKETLCEVNTILENCLTILHYEYKNRIEIVKHYSKKELYLEGNEGQLYQVFTNLIANAIQAIEGEGTITLTTKKYKDTIKVDIEDTGIGIEKENLNKIFDPFFTTKDPGKGTGLGLSIVFNIIEEHSGTIEYQSEVDIGTKVTVKLSSISKPEG